MKKNRLSTVSLASLSRIGNRQRLPCLTSLTLDRPQRNNTHPRARLLPTDETRPEESNPRPSKRLKDQRTHTVRCMATRRRRWRRD